MGKIEKYFYWFCFFLAIYIVIGFKAVPALVEDQLVKNLNENLTQKSTVEKVEFNPFTLSAKIHNFTLGEKDNPTLFFKEFQLDFGLLQSIFELHVNVEKVLLKEPFINVIQDKDGKLNLASLVKPTPEKKEEAKNESSSDIKFLVSKIFLENANINFTKINEKKEEKPYKLALKNINYNLYDLGTYKDILSSNDLKLDINNDTKVSIVGAFNLQPFKMYGKAYINKLKLNELLAYKKEILNFDLDKNAQFDMQLDYDIDASKEFQLLVETNKLELSNINLSQNKKDIIKLEELSVNKLNLDLLKQNIKLETINFNKPFINMIQNKEGLNLAKLTKLPKEKKIKAKIEEKQEERKNNPDTTKPWNVNLSALALNNSSIIFNDKVNKTILKNKDFNLNLANVNLNGSNINLNSLVVKNPNLSFVDNKNILRLNTINSAINLDKLKIVNNVIELNKLSIKKDSLTLNDKKSAFNVKTKKSKVTINKLNLKDGKISINNINLLTPTLNINNKKSRLDISTRNTKIDLNALNINKGVTSISSVVLKNPKLNFKDNKSKLYIKTSNTSIKANGVNINGAKTTVSKISLYNPTLNFKDIKNKTSVDVKTLNLAVNTFISNNGKLYIKNAKLTKPSITFKDSKNNIDLSTKNLTVNINRFSQNKYGLKLNSLRVYEPSINFYNTKDKTKILAKNIDLSVSNITNNRKGLKVQKANLTKPNISVILPAKAKVAKETKVEETAKVVKKQTSKENSKLDIGPVNIINATLNFEDKNLPIPFKTKITKLNGKVSEINTVNSDTTSLEVNGIVDQYGSTKITGIVDPNNIKILTDINMIFKNIDMSNFTPYTGKFIGKEIDSGKLALDLKYNIEKSDLEAKNNIIVTKIKFGKNIKSEDAVSLPLELAIALLEDSNGVIDLNIPVSGNVDDPKFSVAPIVWKAFSNLILKAITAPFSLLGAIFGFSEDEIKSVNFDYGQSDIQPSQKETLDKISQILQKRPNLALELSPSYDKNKDLLALKKAKYNRILTNELPKKNSKTYTRKYISLLEDIYEDYDQKLKPMKKKHTSNKKLNTKTYSAELEKFIISKQDIKTLDLEKMAKSRISNIKLYLTKEKKINQKQIIVKNKINILTTSNKTSNIDLKISKSK